MDREFDVIEFAHYLRTRWRMAVVTCGVAVTLAAAISVMLPKRYTSTASVLIEPPAGNDPRAATAVSPVYLESLKTFERLASSNSLFVDALSHLQVPEGKLGRSIESLKRDILKVSKPANTKVLDIEVTLEDPHGAQALAQYIAEHTVALSRSVDAGAEEEATRESRGILATAKERLKRAQAARDAFVASKSVEVLEDEVPNDAELRLRLRGDLAKAQAELAEDTARQQALASRSPAEASWIAGETAGVRARMEHLAQQDADLIREIDRKGAILESLKSQREALDAELRAARVEYEATANKLNDIRASSAFRGERLQVIDPGIVPNRPSTPNVPLNILAALVLSSLAWVSFLAASFGRERTRPVRSDRDYTARWVR
jgi:uncharacterized protein involved in exopolysaccharide biosynthesis